VPIARYRSGRRRTDEQGLQVWNSHRPRLCARACKDFKGIRYEAAGAGAGEMRPYQKDGF